MYALGSPACDISLSDLAHLTDAFYIGGTKCGALFGEALVITNPALDDCFRASIKQNGGLLAKGWLLGLQFATLFNDGLYLELGKHADEQAMRIRHAFERVGVELYADSSTNQQFVIVNDQQQALLAEHHIFELEKCLDNGMTVIRFCTSWGTEDADIDALLKDIARLA
jgi:threonine aldolase